MKIHYLLFAALILTACESDDDNEPDFPEATTDYILIGNEGAFQGESASLTQVDLDNNTLNQNAFSAANNEAQLGDVLQSMVHRNEEIYLVVNNSGKIEVIDDETLVSKRVISGFTSPRYMCFSSDNKAYVSNLFSNTIDIINPQNGTFSGSIPTTNAIEKMKIHNGEMWCTAPGSNHLYFLDLATDAISDSLTLSAGVSEIAKDANSDFWVMALGTFNEPIVEPAIYKIDGDSKAILDTLAFPEGTGYGGSMEISADGQSVLYLIGGDLYQMPITAEALPAESFIADASVSYYALNVNPVNGEIGLTNAADFSQSGSAYFFTSEGELIDEYPTGIVPHSILWVDE